MLKSIFAKYVTTFMTLLLVSFLLLLFIVNSVFASDSLRAERQDMQGVACASVEHLSDLYRRSGETDFAAFVLARVDAHEDGVDAAESGIGIHCLLEAIITNFEDMTVYVTDARGGFIFSTGKVADHIPAVGTVILGEDYFAALAERVDPDTATDTSPSPGARVRRTTKEEETSTDGVFLDDHEHTFDGGTLAFAMAIPGVNGTVGHVLITSTAEGRTSLMEDTLRSVAVAGLWIMLAALIAIYFTTERIIGPLREMSRAAKKLMVGQFDVRVRVHGKDEVAELAVAFNQMAGALENLDHMRNSFVANVSHDLRTPMTTISGFIDGILDGVIPPEQHAHYLKVVSDEVRRLSRLVTALLDVSRLQAGDRKFDMKPFDVCEMGRQILISFEQKIDAKHLDVDFVCDDERMFVLADRDAIHQILYNICDNAVKFSSDRGCLRMSFLYGNTEGGRGRKVYVKVYNEGQGIPDEDIPFVFERFYKSDKSRSLDKTGVGLGMYIAKTIIDAHKETISVSGEYGHHCEFTFTLARTDPPAPRPRVSNSNQNPTEEASHERNRTK